MRRSASSRSSRYSTAATSTYGPLRPRPRPPRRRASPGFASRAGRRSGGSPSRWGSREPARRGSRGSDSRNTPAARAAGWRKDSKKPARSLFARASNAFFCSAEGAGVFGFDMISDLQADARHPHLHARAPTRGRCVRAHALPRPRRHGPRRSPSTYRMRTDCDQRAPAPYEHRARSRCPRERDRLFHSN